MLTQGQIHLSKKLEYGFWYAEFDISAQLCFASNLSYSMLLVLTNEQFPADKALKLLGDIQAKIYEIFPKIKQEDEEEKLVGAKIYVSDICNNYGTSDPGSAIIQQTPPDENKLKLEEAQNKLAEEERKIKQQIDQQVKAEQPKVILDKN